MMFLTLLACSLLLCIGGTGWPDSQCGRSFVHRRERYVYKARLAEVGEFPWMVSLHIKKYNRRTFCGGSLIKNNTVLTVAHCMRGFSRGYAAAGFLDKKKRGSLYQRRKIKTIVCHKDDCGSLRDIALIKLASPFDIAKSKGRIGTVCLPLINRPLGKEVTITGWGLTSSKIGSQSSHLLAITVPVRDNNFCKTFYPRYFNPKIMFCAGIHGKKQGKGDSGGPAVERIGRRSMQVGITSFSRRRGALEPGFQVKVSVYSHWIADTLKMLQ